MNVKADKAHRMTPAEIRREGFQALLDRLGPAGAIRFIQEYDTGRGDYTQERHAWLDAASDEEILESIKARQKDASSKNP